MSIRPVAILATFAVAACIDATPAHAQAFALAKSSASGYTAAELAPKQPCLTLAAFRAKDLASIEAREVAATETAPAHCRVTGVLSPEIAFEVSLPARWNGRFYMIGNGGHAGESLDDPGRAAQRVQALQNGFAFGQTNTGHDARKEPGASFVLSDPRKAQDYAWRAVHLTAVTAKAITAEYFGRKVARAYWNSCSNGGRQGLVEAQRFPADFDGVVANAPWVSQTGFTIGAVWNQQAVSKAPLTAAKLRLLAARVAARCDAVDGVTDGLIDDPRRCDFDAVRDVPACAAGSEGDDCLTPAQADAVMKVYRGPQAGGKTLFPGFMPGSEAVVAGPGGTANSAWWGLVVPTPERAAADYGLAANTLRFLAHVPPKPDYDPMTFDFTRDPPLLDAWAREVNATSTDLDRFRRRGGKLLMTYGWADQVLQPLMGVQYFEQVNARYGAKTPDFFRLFMVPGMTHCAGGVGPDQFDAVTAVIDWVEKGRPPASLVAAKLSGGKPVRTRPLCPYPQVAKYAGSGSIDDAASFRCAMP